MRSVAQNVSQYRHPARHRDAQPCRNQSCERIQAEIRAAVSGAAEVHHALCAPEWQRVEGFEIATRIVPMRHVGGDFVCTLKAGKSTIAILGDLMGKGLSAAMWITHIIDLVYRAAENFTSLAGMMARLNSELIQSRVRAPLTSAVAVAIDHSVDEISCVSAGHPPAVLLRADSSAELLMEGGPILGVFADAGYKSRTVRLGSGDAIAAFSDGVIDAESKTDEPFSVAGAALALARHAKLNARQKVAALIEASEAFSGGRAMDDVSALVIQHT